MSSPHDEVPVAGASAFNNGRNQTITNSNILNSQGNITFINWNPQLPSILFNNLIKALSDFMKPSSSNPTDSELPPNCNCHLSSKIDQDEDHESPKEDSIIMIPTSEQRAFVPDTLSKAPLHRNIYVKSLFPLGYGYPLWFPQVDHNLPADYRRDGISIGDVGVIDPNGTFDFLSNIWLTADHPLNPNNLPHDYDAISRPQRRTAFQTSFNPGYSTISNLSVKSSLSSTNGEILITCKDGGQGAIIAIPDGASEEDLKNEKDLMEFISQSAMSWYRYARLKSGRKINRHSLYLVTGFMKSKTWGIATFDKTVQNRDSCLVMKKATNIIPGTPYIWKEAGEATTFRTGPTLYTRSGNKDDSSQEGDIENQCLFVRGFKITLSNDMWYAILNGSLTSIGRRASSGSKACRPGWIDYQEGAPFNMSLDGASNLFLIDRVTQKTKQKQHQRVSVNAPSLPHHSRKVGTRSAPHSFSEYPTIGDFSGDNNDSLTTISRASFSTNNDTVHPSDALNDLLLSQVPGAGIAITHDNIWNSLKGCGTAEEINKAISDMYVIIYYKDKRMCSLERRENVQSILVKQERDRITRYSVASIALDRIHSVQLSYTGVNKNFGPILEFGRAGPAQDSNIGFNRTSSATQDSFNYHSSDMLTVELKEEIPEFLPVAQDSLPGVGSSPAKFNYILPNSIFDTPSSFNDRYGVTEAGPSTSYPVKNEITQPRKRRRSTENYDDWNVYEEIPGSSKPEDEDRKGSSDRKKMKKHY